MLYDYLKIQDKSKTTFFIVGIKSNAYQHIFTFIVSSVHTGAKGVSTTL